MDPQMRPIVCGITIDPGDHLERDDSFMIRRIGNEWEVEVSFPDMSGFVPKGSMDDVEACKRAETIYRKRVPSTTMLPPHVWTRASVASAPLTPTITVTVRLSADYTIVDTRFELTSLKVEREYTYEKADSFLMSPKLDPEVPWSLFREFIEGFAHKRNQETAPPGQEVRRKKRTVKATRMIELLMILINGICAAKFLKENRNCLYLNKRTGSDGEYSMMPECHEPYNLPAYVQATTPLRRYVALIINRLLVAMIRNEPAPYSMVELMHLAEYLNRKRTESKNRERGDPYTRHFAHPRLAKAS